MTEAPSSPCPRYVTPEAVASSRASSQKSPIFGGSCGNSGDDQPPEGGGSNGPGGVSMVSVLVDGETVGPNSVDYPALSHCVIPPELPWRRSRSAGAPAKPVSWGRRTAPGPQEPAPEEGQ